MTTSQPMADMIKSTILVAQLKIQIQKVCPLKDNKELFEFIRHAVEQEINRMQQEETK